MNSCETWRARRARRRAAGDQTAEQDADDAPAAAEFTEATFDDEGECPSDGCSTEAAASEEEEMVANAFRARNVRGYQSDRHSTESAHERINSQLAGLHRKKVIRARADGVDLDRETKKETSRSAARRDGSEHVVKDETNSARFYGGVGLQLEESTPESVSSPGEAREGMARGKVHVRRHLQRGRHQTISQGTLASGGGGCIPRRVRVSRERIASYHSVRVVVARSRRSTKRRCSRELEYISRGVVKRGVRSLARARALHGTGSKSTDERTRESTRLRRKNNGSESWRRQGRFDPKPRGSARSASDSTSRRARLSGRRVHLVSSLMGLMTRADRGSTCPGTRPRANAGSTPARASRRWCDR